MSVGREQAEAIATLARLRFDAADLDRITEELNRILEYVEALRALGPPDGLGGSEGTSGYLDAELESTRARGAEEPDPLGMGLDAVAPNWREGFFVVPPLPGVHAEGDS
jgi:hypothetical protein